MDLLDLLETHSPTYLSWGKSNFRTSNAFGVKYGAFSTNLFLFFVSKNNHFLNSRILSEKYKYSMSFVCGWIALNRDISQWFLKCEFQYKINNIPALGCEMDPKVNQSESDPHPNDQDCDYHHPHYHHHHHLLLLIPSVKLHINVYWLPTASNKKWDLLREKAGRVFIPNPSQNSSPRVAEPFCSAAAFSSKKLCFLWFYFCLLLP